MIAMMVTTCMAVVAIDSETYVATNTITTVDRHAVADGLRDQVGEQGSKEVPHIAKRRAISLFPRPRMSAAALGRLRVKKRVVLLCVSQAFVC